MTMQKRQFSQLGRRKNHPRIPRQKTVPYSGLSRRGRAGLLRSGLVLVSGFLASGLLASGLLAPGPAAAQNLTDSPPAGVISAVVTATPPALGAQTMADGARQGKGGLLSKRRSLGVAFIAGSVLLTMQGFDFKDEADGFYAAYKTATDPADIDKFYQRTTNRDVKSQVSWALAAAFGVTGLRLALTGGTSATATRPAAAQQANFAVLRQPSVTLAPAVTARTVGLLLQRHFH